MHVNSEVKIDDIVKKTLETSNQNRDLRKGKIWISIYVNIRS
jgi:hypothetical protein